MSLSTELVTVRSLRSWPLPEGGGSKYERGQVVVVGGASSAPGAALLAGESALRVGAGRLTLVVADAVAAPVATALPECAVLELGGRHEEYGRADAVLIGPGLDEIDETRRVVDSVLSSVGADTVLVLDAFALGVLAETAVGDGFVGRIILTPNRGEAERLLGRELDDELSQLGEIADRFGAIVTCFGTVVAPGGQRWQVDVDSPHLGTSGSGDVLAGAILGLSARGATAEQATVWATFLHHRSGQLAGAPPGAVGYLARDLVRALPMALRELNTNEKTGSA